MPRSAEEQAIASRRGKWFDAGVPHRGWHCVEIEDLGAPNATCEMCEAQSIRYVHYMEHADYAETLACGCVCAGHMEQDLAAARERDESMRSRAGKRARWLTRRWKVSAKGNDWLEADGFRVTIFERNGGWAAAVIATGGTYRHFSRRTYVTENQAKLAAFDLITRLLQSGAFGGV
ncbi:MAG: hypothetical protein AB1941_23290 [Gemmatimonadota bacterium]